MRIPTSTPPRHADRWEAIRYALDSNSRTIRFCLIWIVVIGTPTLVVTATGLLPHLVSRLLG